MSATNTVIIPKNSPKVTIPVAAANSQNMCPSIVMSANSAWNIVNFRAGLIRDLIASGHRVVVVAPADGYESRLAALGAEFEPIEINSSGMSIIEDSRLLLRYRRILRRLQPAAFLGFTVKPNIYGSLAAALSGVKAINNISGLGTAFLRRGPLQSLVGGLYRLALRRSATIFFQNREDLRMFVDRGLADRKRSRLLPGSGIDLERFAPPPVDAAPGRDLRFLLVARLLWDKGIAEYVAAARIVRARYPAVRFDILGFLGADNRSAVPPDAVAGWQEEGVVDYLGSSDDVRPFVRQADCVVLPSYREGMPRSLLEASAMARPLIASDVPGCREIVDDGVNGFLCEVRSGESLAAAMIRMVELDPAERIAMGKSARLKVEREFDHRLIGAAYLEAIDRG